MTWAIVPAAGSGARFGGDIPKQYCLLDGKPLLAQTLSRLLAPRRIDGVMLALAADDAHWRTLHHDFGKPVLTCVGGVDRAASVLAALRALPASVDADALVLVHDAARPCVRVADLDRLLAATEVEADGALLAAPVADTLKRADARGCVDATVARDGLWRALTPQAFRRGLLTDALERADADGITVTDEAMAIERMGRHPRLVEGRQDNIKVTVAEDLALAEHILAIQRHEGEP